MESNRNLPTLVTLTPLAVLVFLLFVVLFIDRTNAQEVVTEDLPKEEAVITAPTVTNFAPAYLSAKGIVLNREQEEDRRFDLIMKQLIQIRNDCK